MEIIYEGKKIDVNVSECTTIDNLGNKLDSMMLAFADVKSECTTWNFKKGQSIKIIDSPFSTGIMYVDDYGISENKFYLRALPVKKKIKTKEFRTWENVTFLDLAKDIAAKLNMKLATYGVTNYTYERIDQVNKNSISFLNFRCMLEGYILKLNNETLNIISEKYIQSQNASKSFSKEDFINKEFKCNSNSIISGCEIFSNSNNFISASYIKSEYIEDVLKINNIRVSSSEEAERYAKNIVQQHNKYEYSGKFTIKKDTEISAGSIINVNGVNSFSGKYAVEKIINYHCGGKSKLYVRRISED